MAIKFITQIVFKTYITNNFKIKTKQLVNFCNQLDLLYYINIFNKKIVKTSQMKHNLYMDLTTGAEGRNPRMEMV